MVAKRKEQNVVEEVLMGAEKVVETEVVVAAVQAVVMQEVVMEEVAGEVVVVDVEDQVCAQQSIYQKIALNTYIDCYYYRK